MKFRIPLLAAVLLSGLPALATGLGTSARVMIPGSVQQIISVDYRTLRNSPTGMALKERVIPENLRSLEGSLRGVGIDAGSIEQITFASVRGKDGSLRLLGLASGSFTRAKVLQQLRAQKVRPVRFRDTNLYPMGGGMEMTFADPSTLVFGDPTALRQALDARDGFAESLAANSQMTDMMSDVDSGAVWSVLDSIGTQTMLRSALGQASSLDTYGSVSQRLLGSRYAMDFGNGVNFDLKVATTDQMTAATLSSLLQAALLFRKQQATGVEKTALDNVSVDSDSHDLKVHFESDDQRFQALMKSDIFKMVSH
ncbi:MAG TPA: hypothetical protein VLT85_12395 [Terriglobales bacterium]|nr:hypothetical protein [Terriglobales bacterium]